MNLLTEAKKAVVIKNTHLYEAMITLYLGDWFNPKDKKSIIYRVFNTNDKERYAYFCEKSIFFMPEPHQESGSGPSSHHALL